MDWDAINLLLETFKECTRRSNHATLFLETRDGQQFGTLRLRTPAVKPKPNTTVGNQQKARKKSPSTIRRNQQRLRTFLQSKSSQESLDGPSATSTPTITRAKTDSSRSSQVVDKSGTLDQDKLAKENCLERQEQETDNEAKSDNENNSENSVIGRAITSVISENKIDFSPEHWTHLFRKLEKHYNDLNDQEQKEKKEDDDTSTHIENLDNNEEDPNLDHIEEAKLWAMKQKQSCIKS